MQISELKKGQYIIVYDLGKSENSEGREVVGRVIGLERSYVPSLAFIQTDNGIHYNINNNNYFDLWSNSIEDKTESVSEKSILKVGLGISKPATEYKQSNDLQQRKRNGQNTKPDYYQFDDFEMYEIVEAICKHYNPVVAAWIGQAIQYIGRAPRKNGKEDIGKARDMIEQAFKSWDK